MYEFNLKVRLSNELFKYAIRTGITGILDSILEGMFYKACVSKFKEHDLDYSEYGLQLLGQSSNLTKSKSNIIIFERHYVTTSKLPFATKLDK